MSETVLTCYEKIRTLKQDAYFKTWMIRIMINHCKDILRAQRRNIAVESVPEMEEREAEVGREGYVLNIIAGYGIDREELIKFADNLKVERIGDGNYETAKDKVQREQEENDAEALAAEGAINQDALMELGIPQEKVYSVGEELRTYQGAYGYGKRRNTQLYAAVCGGYGPDR